MRYFYDTEFIDDGKTIDLISIGIVSEDGREFYRISKEFDESNASEWVVDNVLPTLVDQKRSTKQQIKRDLINFIGNDIPEFWAYYSSYDHVVICQLFGTMMDLPRGWPMYTKDIKQLCDSKGNPKLPYQYDEHNALSDAIWNMKSYNFLMSI